MKLKPIQTIHLALCGGLIIFAAVSFLIIENNFVFSFDNWRADPTLFIFPTLALLTLVIANTMYAKLIANIQAEASLDKKLMGYQTALIIKFAFFEAGGLMNTVGFLVSGNLFFMVFAAISFLALLLARPTKDKAIQDLQLQYPDTESL